MVFGLAIAGLLAVVAGAPPARAHEHVTVGEYEFTVGWIVEPSVVGVLNGLDLGIQDHLPNGTTVWVEGAEGNLTATLSYGSDSKALQLEPQWNRPGWYTFSVLPTRDGQYSVRLRGTLNTTSVDVIVNLDPVDPASSVSFPAIDPTASEVEQEIAGLRIQMTVGVGIGAVGVAVGVIALVWEARRGRRERDTP